MTTQWQSMFAGGPCTVSFALLPGAAPTWSGVLGAGGSSPQFTDAGTTFQITIDANGVLTLLASSPSSAGTVWVTPNYDCSKQQTNIASISRAVTTGTPAGYASNLMTAAIWNANLSFNGATGVCTPNSMSFAATATPALGVYCGGPA